MRKTFIFAAILLAVATTITIVSCKKDKETVKNNISENSMKSYELSEMDKTMIAFGEKLKSASNERSGETMPLEEALKIFEDGIQLAKGMEKELDKIEGKIQILMNQPKLPEDKCELDLFSSVE